MKRRELIKGAAMVASLPVTRLGATETADPPAAGGDRWRGLKVVKSSGLVFVRTPGSIQ